MKKVVVLTISVVLLIVIATVFLISTKGTYENTKYYRSFSGEVHLNLNVYPEDMIDEIEIPVKSGD